MEREREVTICCPSRMCLSMFGRTMTHHLTLNRVLGGPDEAMTTRLPALLSPPPGIVVVTCWNRTEPASVLSRLCGVAVPGVVLVMMALKWLEPVALVPSRRRRASFPPLSALPCSVSADRPEQEAAGCRVSGLQEGSSAGRSADRQLTLSAAQVA